VYGGWPRSGEVDVMESKRNENYVDGSDQNIGNILMGSNLQIRQTVTCGELNGKSDS